MLKVLIPVDGSDHASNAVRHVIERSRQGTATEVHLLHVCMQLPQSISRFVSQRDLDVFHNDEAIKTMAPAKVLLTTANIPFVEHVELGGKAETIQRVAKKIGADEIVIGTGRKNSFTRLVEGSLTNQVMAISDVPVEVITSGEESSVEKYGLPAGIGAAFALLVVASE